jgi:DNA repair protein SbcD/Mre11
MSIKIIATSDLHIGKKVTGIEGSGPELSTREIWKRIVDHAINSKIDVLALAGDIVDHNNRYFEAVAPLQSAFKQLRESNIHVFMVAGNHDFDVLPQILKSNEFNNVHLIGENGTWEVCVFTKGAETLQFVGWSFPSQFYPKDPTDSLDELSIDTSIPAIGLLHGEIGIRGSIYAPINLSALQNSRIGTWIVGHIHKPDVWSENPYIFYPGSPLALNPKETGTHGPLMIKVENGIVGGPLPLFNSTIRFEKLEIDVSEAVTEESFRMTATASMMKMNEALRPQLDGVSRIVYDVELTGTHEDILHLEEWSNRMSVATDHGNIGETIVSVRKVETSVKPSISNLEILAVQSSPAGILAQIILNINKGDDSPLIIDLLKEWKIKQNEIRLSDTYRPLRNQDGPEEDPDKLGRQSILKESIRLLGTLLQQNRK